MLQSQPVIGSFYFSQFPVIRGPGMGCMAIIHFKNSDLNIINRIEIIGFQEATYHVLLLRNALDLLFGELDQEKFGNPSLGISVHDS